MAIKRLFNDSSLANNFKASRGQTSAAIPNTPTIGTATTVNDISATVTYTAAVLGAAGNTFTATSNPGSLTGTGASPITVSGLTASTNYTFTVTATNANGTSPTSAASNEITTDAPITIADLIIIAGGGAGGPGGGSGGGGAGGLVYLASQSITGTNTVTIGAGGPKTASTVVSGVNSSFGSLTAAVGGGGGGYSATPGNPNNDGNTGGSGGGGAIDCTGRATGTSGQGNQGGLGKRGSNNILSGGGGGGAGAAGVDAGTSIDTPGAGGDGVSTYSSWGSATSSGQNISGTYWYAGGGAGYGWNIVGTAAAGRGGGGNYASVNGATNTGGGGFAGSTGNGGSGIVIIKYPTSKTITIGAGLTGTTYTSGGYKYTKITAGTGNVSWA